MKLRCRSNIFRSREEYAITGVYLYNENICTTEGYTYVERKRCMRRKLSKLNACNRMWCIRKQRTEYDQDVIKSIRRKPTPPVSIASGTAHRLAPPIPPPKPPKFLQNTLSTLFLLHFFPLGFLLPFPLALIAALSCPFRPFAPPCARQDRCVLG